MVLHFLMLSPSSMELYLVGVLEREGWGDLERRGDLEGV